MVTKKSLLRQSVNSQTGMARNVPLLRQQQQQQQSVKSQTMDRGSPMDDSHQSHRKRRRSRRRSHNNPTNALERNLSKTSHAQIHKMERDCCEKSWDCNAGAEYRFSMNQQVVAHGKEEMTDCCFGTFCFPINPYMLVVTESKTADRMFLVDRPLRCIDGPFKCCCFQEATIRWSDGTVIGTVKETCHSCVFEAVVYDGNDEPMYRLYRPTCCGGICINSCTEDECCAPPDRIPIHIFPAAAANGEDDNNVALMMDGRPIGKIQKKKEFDYRSTCWSNASVVDIDFPRGATVEEKASLLGSTVLLTSLVLDERRRSTSTTV